LETGPNVAYTRLQTFVTADIAGRRETYAARSVGAALGRHVYAIRVVGVTVLMIRPIAKQRWGEV
jgi:hypothetical protein